jgi:hypothetical protein
LSALQICFAFILYILFILSQLLRVRTQERSVMRWRFVERIALFRAGGAGEARVVGV